MLHIKNSVWEVFQSKKLGDSIMIEPSLFINNFLVRSLDKFGVVKAPEKVIEEIMNNPEKNIIHDLGVKGGDIFRRPIYGNLNAIFEATTSNLAQDKTVFATPAIAALFIHWGIENSKDLDFDLISDPNMEEIAEAFASESLKELNPLSLERLLKLFSIFYAKKIEKQEVKELSSFQIHLLALDKEEKDLESIDTTKVEEIVNKVFTENQANFSSNNIFNKILEEISSLKTLQNFGYNMRKDGNFTIFTHKEETIQSKKEEFLKLIEG